MDLPIVAPWAKVTREGKDGPLLAWMPLEHHSGDVSAVFEALLRLPGYRALCATLLGREVDEVTIARLCLLAFVHDIGKGNSGFQAKVMPPEERNGLEPRGHLMEAFDLLLFKADGFARALRVAEMQAWFDDPMSLLRMLVATWSHHGKPLRLTLNETNPDKRKKSPDWRTWKWASPEVTLALFEREIAANHSGAFDPAPAMTCTPEFQAFFVGLLTLADWIASDTRWFGFENHGGKERAEWSRELAPKVLSAMGLDACGPRTGLLARPGGFADVFGFAPRAIQLAMLDAAVRVGKGGSVTLLEAETGLGKTEAAIAFALNLYRRGLIDGVYMALPTRTSGVQIHKRLIKAVEAAFGDKAPPVLLAVPGYALPGHNERGMLTEAPVRWDGDADETRVSPAHGWFGENPKRYLAAPFAAGTIDQLLLAGLKVKHAHMRAACHARYLLVIDEVHASDPYMTEIARHVVERHARHGGHALLMSATLGAAAAHAYMHPGSRTSPTLSEAIETPYPLIRVRHGDTETVETVPVQVEAGKATRQKTVTMHVRRSIADPTAIARLAADHARRGAKVLIIRNTVGACIDVRRELERLLPPDLVFSCHGKSAPHHGRFVASDRRLLDRAVEEQFGKERAAGGRVLVATQTVEQSLDIDADVLITDICPIDVLLQRLGRLHRHDRTAPGKLTARAEGYDEASCFVLAPDDLEPLTARAAHGIGNERAYEDVRVVELTLRRIAVDPVFVIPAQNRMLVEACVHPEALSRIDGEGAAWRSHGSKVSGGFLGERSSARKSLLDVTTHFGTRKNWEGWDETVATRLGETPLTAAFDELTGIPRSPFDGTPIRMLPVPRWMTKGDATPPVLLAAGPDGFSFGFAGRRYDYGTDGLSLAKE
jgi:CRISPR-associated endonuclease/helicase Cas3